MWMLLWVHDTIIKIFLDAAELTTSSLKNSDMTHLKFDDKLDNFCGKLGTESEWMTDFLWSVLASIFLGEGG